MTYELKDKINTTNELLSELEVKSWQEIEYLQAQIANLSEGSTNDRLRQLFKNLLTSYYVFAGGIETLLSEPNTAILTRPVQNTETDIIIDEPITVPTITESAYDFAADEAPTNITEVTEPFEYFVDFDEPTGDPISDEDLYGN